MKSVLNIHWRTDAKNEVPILWPPDAKSWLSGKRLWCWASFRAGGVRDDRGWDDWMASPSQWAWVWAISGRQIVKDRGAWHVAVHEVAKSQIQLSDWTATFPYWAYCILSPGIRNVWFGVEQGWEDTFTCFCPCLQKVFNKHMINPSFPITEMKYI